jgi:TolB-like protein/DNA-binding winged helix-turn-helix (wHTH) protein/tetratricopeptide (TPR) repeat protein
MEQVKFADRVRFGSFEADLRRGEVRRNGESIKLQEKPFQVLTLLLEQAGELVTREELRQRVWPADTFVDFDANLNTALNKLRRALSDSADNPVFIKTIPRRGYRFIAPVTPVGLETSAQETRVVHDVPVEPAAPEKVRPVLRGLRMPVAVLALLGVVLLSSAVYFFRPVFSNAVKPPSDRLHLIVLPFGQLDSKPGEDYFTDGMTDELITELAQAHPQELGVIARTTAMQYKNTNKTIEQIGRELNVDYLLAGSVRRSNGRVRISVRLIRTRDQSPLWAESYERDTSDVLAIQREVAASVVHSLPLQLLPSRSASGSAPPAVNPAAYEDYLKGRFYWNKRTYQDLEKSLEEFRSAIEKDPNYAPAYAGLGESYVVLGDWLIMPADEVYPKAREAARKALELDKDLGNAHALQAVIAWEYDRDWKTADAEFQRALETNPGLATTHQWHAEYLSALGRQQEALAEIKRARELDPLSLIINAVVGYVLYDARRYDEAIPVLRKTLEMDPHFFPAHVYLWWVYNQKGMHDAAVDEYEKAMTGMDAKGERAASFRRAYATGGIHGAQRWILGRLTEQAAHSYVNPYHFVVIYSALGEKDKAFEWLDKAFEQHDIGVARMKIDPKLDPLRSDPRFGEYLKRLRLPG